MTELEQAVATSKQTLQETVEAAVGLQESLQDAKEEHARATVSAYGYVLVMLRVFTHFYRCKKSYCVINLRAIAANNCNFCVLIAFDL